MGVWGGGGGEGRGRRGNVEELDLEGMGQFTGATRHMGRWGDCVFGRGEEGGRGGGGMMWSG